MRQFNARTVTGPIDPYTLLVRLWPSPQMSRMLTYSVIIHLCLAATFMIVRAARFYLRPKHDVVYTVNLIEAPRPAPKKKVVKAVPPKPKPPEVKKKEPPPPPPKPPEPKPVVKVEPKPKPPEVKKVEPPKIETPPPPKEKPPEVIAKPEPPKPKKEEAPPPPPPEPEPVKVADAPEPEPEPVVTNTVEVDTDYITPELKWYIEIIRRKVWQNWIEPRHALSSSANIRVVIRFEIGRSGRFVVQPSILESSNNEFFDQSGYAAVMRAAPFPPLPESYSGESLGVQFGFEFGERV